MKKVLSALLVAMLVISLATTAFAAERGQTVEVTFTASGNPGFAAMAANLKYDSSVLEYVSATVHLSGLKVNKKMMTYFGSEDVTGDIDLCTVTFKVKDNAAFGTYSVGATVDTSSTFNYDYSPVTFAVTGGSVTVECKHANMSEWSEKSPATCDDAQLLERHCLDCGENKEIKDGEGKLGHKYGKWIKVDENEHKRTCANDPSHVETKEHSWDKGVVTTQPDCKNPGVTTYTCADCGATKTENKPAATGKHSFTKFIKDDGVNHIFQCTGCDETKTEEHKYDLSKFEIELEPTCGATGSKKYHCTVEGCTAWFGEEIPATGKHTFETWKTDGADTHTATCTGCGKATETVAHTWNKGEVTTQPTCKLEGEKTYTCTAKDCGQTKKEPVAATGKHVYTASYKDNGDGKTHTGVCACGTENPTKEQHKLSLKETINPDCKNDGKKIYQCTLCDAKFEETLPSTGNHNYETWKSDGEKTHTSTCTGCNSEKKTEDHIWNKGEITKQPTCKEEGVKTFTCTAKGCGETKTEAIAKTTNHTYGDWTPVEGTDNHEHVCTVCNTAKETKAHEWKLKEKVAATCVAEGKEDYTCICGAEKTVVLPVDKDAHKLGYTKNEETENHTVFCENEGCTLAPFFEEHNHNIFGDRVGNKQEKLCACGDKITEVVKSNSADLDDVPKTGDITGQIVAFVVCGLAAMMAVAFTFKRKAVK